jgi:Zn-dependent peptidase ImmA (M78 family)
VNPVKRAAQLLAQYGGETLPVPVETIAQALGYRVARTYHVGDQCSFLARSATGETALGVNTARGVRSQLFATAHALGHGEFAPGRELVVCREIQTSDQGPTTASWAEEEAATRFAVELTMPRDRVFTEARAAFPDDHRQRDAFVKALATKFGVTYEAIAFRLVDLAILSP